MIKNIYGRITGFSLLLWLLVCSPLAYAQDAPEKQMSYGARIGGTFSKFSQDQAHTGSKLGFLVGGFFSYTLNDFLAVQPELLYMQQGGSRLGISSQELNPSFTQSISSEKITLHNLEIPVLVKVGYPGLTSAIQPKLFAGPALGINLAATERYDKTIIFSDGTKVVAKGKENVGSRYQSINWGIYLGGGMETQVSSYLLSIDVRYRFGINGVSNYNQFDSILSNANDIRSNTIAVTVGVGF